MHAIVAGNGALRSPALSRPVAKIVLLAAICYLVNSTSEAQQTSDQQKAVAARKKGDALFVKGKFDQAIVLYTRAIRLKKGYADAHLYRGICYDQLDKADKAFKDFVRVVQLNPKSREGYYYRGVAYYNKNDWERARGDFSQCVRIKKDDAASYGYRSWCFYKLGKRDRALKDCDRAIALNALLPLAYVTKGVIYQDRGEYEQSLAVYREANQKFPKASWPYLRRATVRSIQNRHDEAIAAYNQALALEPRYAAALRARGYEYQQKEQFQKALADYTSAIDIEPRVADGYFSRGQTYQRLRYYAQAIDDFTTSVRLQPSFVIYYFRGQCHAARGDHATAVEDFTAALEIDPEVTQVYFARASSRLALGETELAATDQMMGRELAAKARAKARAEQQPLVKTPPPELANTDSTIPVEHSIQRSTGVVVGIREGRVQISGTCWLLDRKKGLVITNDHVPAGYTELYVYFPRYDKAGRIYTHSSRYVNEPNQIRAWLVATDPRRDLAMLRLDEVPDDVPEVALAATAATTGQIVHSAGNSGASYRPAENSILFFHKRGRIGRVVPFQVLPLAGGNSIEAAMLETDSVTRPGDSGGPMVDEDGRLVGVVFAGGTAPDASNSWAIATSELRAFLNDGGRRAPAASRTLVGTWKYAFGPDGKKSFLRFTFNADGTVAMEGPTATDRGSYKVANGKLTLELPRLRATVPLTWQNDGRFTAAFSDGTAQFDRW